VDSDQLLAAWAAPEPKEQGWRNLVGAPVQIKSGYLKMFNDKE